MLKNKLSKYVALFVVVITVFVFTGCNNNDDEPFVFDPNATFILYDLLNLTNQEALEMMIQHPHAIFHLMDLADDILLRGNFEIKDRNTVDVWEELQMQIQMQGSDLDEWLLQMGFTEAEFMEMFELEALRMDAARHLVDIEDEFVEEVFGMWYGQSDYTLEDKFDEVQGRLIDNEVEQLIQPEVANLRAAANFEIFNQALATAYEEYLERIGSDAVLAPATSDVENDVIARINDVDITVADLFQRLELRIGMAAAFNEIDELIIARGGYTVDPAAVYEEIASMREQFGESFAEVTDEEFFEHLEPQFLEEVIMRAHRAPDEETLLAMHGQMTETAGARHILVNDESFALELIAQLEEADDVEGLFAELAAEYSNCGSAADGGNLQTWSRGAMVAEFDNAVFDELAVGEFTTTPVETQFGFHIIFKTYGAPVPSFEDARDDLIRFYINQLRQMHNGYEVLMLELRHNAGLTFGNPSLQTRFEFLANVD